MPNQALGRQPKRPLAGSDRERWRGVSHFDSEDLAKLAAGQSPWLGTFIATVAIPPGAAIRHEQTYRSGHWTLWGEPADLLALVVSVVPPSESYTLTMKCELWDTELRNLLYHFDTEGEALEAARELIALNPTIYPTKLALIRVEAEGQMTTVAAGAKLAMRLRATEAQRGRLPA